MLECAYFTLPWSKTQYEDALAQNNFKAFGVFENMTLLSYITLSLAGDTLEVINIATVIHERQKGHAHRLLNFTLRYAEKLSIVEINLEVRESNLAAIALYTDHGFVLVGRRKNYYTQQTTTTDTPEVCKQTETKFFETKSEDALIYKRLFS